MKQLFLKDTASLIDAMGGKELYGLTPAEKYKVTEWKFPVLLEIDTKNKTFKLVEEEAKEPVKEEPKQETVTKKKKNWFKTGFVIAAAVVTLVIIGVVIFKVL